MDLCLVALVLTSSSASTGSDQVSTWSLVSWFKFLTLSLNSGTLCISFYSCIVYLSLSSLISFLPSLCPFVSSPFPLSILPYLYPCSPILFTHLPLPDPPPSPTACPITASPSPSPTCRMHRVNAAVAPRRVNSPTIAYPTWSIMQLLDISARHSRLWSWV